MMFVMPLGSSALTQVLTQVLMGGCFFQAVSSIEKSPILGGRKTTATLVREAMENIGRPSLKCGRF
jgi:hypothetical protein